MSKTNLIVIGGFLGAGKTTSILAIARRLLGMGKKIGIVTNDQGSRLVDTNFLEKEGLPVLEVAGGCFCCNFDEFTEKLNRLSTEQMPDLILAEPVGSCTDLIATIFKPMQIKHTGRFTLNPLTIVADPRRVKKLMMEEENSLLPTEIGYLFRKQLEEADIIVLNKTDTLCESEASAVVEFLKGRYAGAEVLLVSAKEGRGIDEWINAVIDGGTSLNYIRDIDYETYARAEQCLGWLNSSAIAASDEAKDMNSFVYDYMSRLRRQLENIKAEIVHLKVYAVSRDDWAKAGITSLFDSIDFSRKMSGTAHQANVITNARVNAGPEVLKKLVEETFTGICEEYGMEARIETLESFKPGKPVPKYQIRY